MLSFSLGKESHLEHNTYTCETEKSKDTSELRAKWGIIDNCWSSEKENDLAGMLKREEPLNSPESQQVKERRKPRGWSFAFGSAFTWEASANFEG